MVDDSEGCKRKSERILVQGKHGRRLLKKLTDLTVGTPPPQRAGYIQRTKDKINIPGKCVPEKNTY